MDYFLGVPISEEAKLQNMNPPPNFIILQIVAVPKMFFELLLIVPKYNLYYSANQSCS